MEFWVFAAVTFVLLIWGHLANCTDNIGRELNWMISTITNELTYFKDVVVNSNNICKCLFANILISFFLVHKIMFKLNFAVVLQM